MATEEEKVLKEVQVIAMRKYGRPFDALSEDEKKAIFRDYVGERDVANAEYVQGQDLIDTPNPEGRQAGDIYVASNPLENLGVAAQQGVGAYQQRGARKKLEGLSKDYQLGSRAAGDVAANTQGNQMNMLSQMIRKQQSTPAAPAAPAASAAPAAPAARTGPAPMGMGMGGGQPGGQIPLRPGQPGAPQPNAPMLANSGAPPAMGDGTPVPRNKEEWQAYLIRNMNAGSMY